MPINISNMQSATFEGVFTARNIPPLGYVIYSARTSNHYNSMFI